jgi:diketogulonate reductase-like aldo/keto reductase
MGNSNAFRNGDRTASVDLIRLFHEHGGAYIDCSGDSRFVVAEAAHGLGIGSDLFLGSYFADGDDVAMRGEVRRLLAASGKDRLDLAHSYPEYAVPNWRQFQRWKDEGLTRYIGVARHQSDYYDSMMDLMKTGTVDFLQVNYSPLETEADRLVLPTAMDRGVAVTINRPFINGAYFAQVRGHPLPDWAAEFDCASWAQFSLKFILSHPAVTCVLTETANPEHLRDNIGAGFGRLPDPPMRNRMAEYLQGL